MLIGNKTRILVTHHVHLLSQCDQIVILEDGHIKASGTYDELSNSGIDITAFIPKQQSSTNLAELNEESSLEVTESNNEETLDAAVEEGTKTNILRV